MNFITVDICLSRALRKFRQKISTVPVAMKYPLDNAGQRGRSFMEDLAGSSKSFLRKICNILTKDFVENYLKSALQQCKYSDVFNHEFEVSEYYAFGLYLSMFISVYVCYRVKNQQVRDFLTNNTQHPPFPSNPYHFSSKVQT